MTLVRFHLASGAQLDVDLPDGQYEDIDDVLDKLEGTPHWQPFGDAGFHTQAVSAVELL